VSALGALSQTVRACGPMASRLSRSLRVIHSDTDPTRTYDFLLTNLILTYIFLLTNYFLLTMDLSRRSTCSEVNPWRLSCKTHFPNAFNAPPPVESLHVRVFVTPMDTEITGTVMALPVAKKSLNFL